MVPIRNLNRIFNAQMGPTVWMSGAQVIRLTCQAGVFVIVAQGLGSEGFGAFTATLAVVGIIAPFVEMGAYSLIIRDIAAKVPTAQAMGASMLATLALLPVAIVALVAARMLFLTDVPWPVVTYIAIGGFVGSKLVAIARGVTVAHNHLKYTAGLEFLVGAGQIGAALALLPLGGSLSSWAMLYMAQSLSVGCVALLWCIRRWGRPSWDLRALPKRITEGIQFATATAAQGMYTDIDKAMLARLSGLSAAGVFSAAHRIVSVAFIPLMAYLASVYPRFFAAGRNGFHDARQLAWEVLIPVLAYGVLAATAIWLGAPILVHVLGADYAEAPAATRILSLLLIVQALQYPFADALSGSGQQGLRTVGQIVGIAVSVSLNWLLIPRLGWAGAAWATIITQGLLLLYFLLGPTVLETCGKTVRHFAAFWQGSFFRGRGNGPMIRPVISGALRYQAEPQESMGPPCSASSGVSTEIEETRLRLFDAGDLPRRGREEGA